jgi:hypothetical protein
MSMPTPAFPVVLFDIGDTLAAARFVDGRLVLDLFDSSQASCTYR